VASGTIPLKKIAATTQIGLSLKNIAHAAGVIGFIGKRSNDDRRPQTADRQKIASSGGRQSVVCGRFRD
jgi:hypothetical protein